MERVLGAGHRLGERWVDVLLPGLVFVFSLGFYIATLSPGLSFVSPDGNELITVCATLGLAHATGYPLYTWLGKLFTLLPLGTVAYRVNLMSAVLGAGGVALLYGVIYLVTKRRLPALFVALLFAFSRTFWSQATIAEVYTPNLFMVVLTLFLFLLWAERKRAGVSRSEVFLLLGVLSLALSLGTHLSNLGFVPAYGLFVLMVAPWIWRRPLLIVGAVLMFALGCLQFLWLPFKAENLTDALMLRNSPTTWGGFYNYTLGAFPQMKFAFTLGEIPERVVLYLDLLQQNVGVLGILTGLYGLIELLWRRTAYFYLLVGMYLVHVFFFVQYRVFDLDVFFIPAHLLYTIAIGYGVACIVLYIKKMVGRVGWWVWAGRVLAGLMVILLPGGVVVQAGGNYAWEDRSGDTAVEDFYINVFRFLPQDSVLLGQAGVFGYDMFYFRLVEGVRPDVILPLLNGPRVRPEEVRGKEVYTTVLSRGGGRGGPGNVSADVLSPGSWFVPVLVGESNGMSGGFPGRALVLYRISDVPPDLIVQQAEPQVSVAADLGGLFLEGYTLGETEVEAGGVLHLTLYWRLGRQPRGEVATALGDQQLEAHPLAFGNLERYVQEIRPLKGGVVVEEYALVVPADTPVGSLPLRVRLVQPLVGKQGEQGGGQWVEVGMVAVTQ